MSNTGYLVISLDLELYWGMFDKMSLEQYGENIRGAHHAVPLMLSLFRERGIHATWGTVGLLACENKATLRSMLPPKELQPVYADMHASAYEYIEHASLGNNAMDDPYHYGKHLLDAVVRTPHQELGSHTFSHYYCLDGENNSEAVFSADCEAFLKAVSPFGRTIRSIIFPRNQMSAKALAVCKQYGITTYRGTPDHFLYTAKKEDAQTNVFLRILRLLDAYLNISGHHTTPLSQVQKGEFSNVRGSWFLRPYSHSLRWCESLRINRIKRSMTHAAKRGEVFHLWWHPHNFGINRKENLQNLLLILDHFAYLQETYGMQSATMDEVATASRG